MAIELFANNAITTLNGAVGTTNPEVITVSSAAAFPTTGNFRILIETEILLVTAVSGSDFTCVRGVEGTTNAAHADGTAVALILTLGSFEQYLLDRGITTTCLGDRKPQTPGTYDEEFEGTADTLPADWAWTVAPSGTDAWFVNSRWPSKLTVEGISSYTTYTLTRSNFTPGAIDFGIWAKVHVGPSRGSGAGSDLRLYVSDSTGNDMRGLNLFASTYNNMQMRLLKTVGGGSEALEGTAVNLSPADLTMYFGYTHSAAGLWTAFYSRDGVSWQYIGNQATHTFTPNKLILKLQTVVVQTFAGIDWLRYRTDLEFPRFN